MSSHSYVLPPSRHSDPPLPERHSGSLTISSDDRSVAWDFRLIFAP